MEQYLMENSPGETGNIFHCTLEHKQPPPSKYHLKRLQAFEHWASESSCLLKGNGDSDVGVNLVDEIHRLLDSCSKWHPYIVPPQILIIIMVIMAVKFPLLLLKSEAPCIQLPFWTPPIPSRRESIQDKRLMGMKYPKFHLSDLNKNVHLGTSAISVHFLTLLEYLHTHLRTHVVPSHPFQ